MRRFTIFWSLCIPVCFLLSGCGKIYRGNEELIHKAREEISVSSADTINLIIAGNSQEGNNYLFWFISGNEKQAHTYTPIEFLSKNTDEYTFVKTYKPIERIADIALLMWNDGYSFVVNNKSCKYIHIKKANGDIVEVNVESIPFVYYIDEIPAEYIFMDSDKTVLQQ